ncbi:fluoride efflux transporter CrcB [Paenibacillus flagellatus]|uniref:Fluoride-specific ion channel FluC n=1 Tax=Paenibacillus flagellatus TaxID=2211139 RepID=A0A2V5K506_9BACL|nr:fluoride efflux transporter CrcB [Paenibacillus flagellatus]PYI54435.1 fluoride efflux transporter CrcB [Paenibacillus flagellatus]
MMWTDVGLVAAGGFLGAVARYYVSKKIGGRFQSAVPYGTLTVNLTGCFALGLLVGADWGHAVSLLAGTGFMGAYTTFSTFKAELVALARQSRYGALIGYIAATYSLGIAWCYIGYCVGRSI